MPSSIALGCNGYEAHMQQILTPYGVSVVTEVHDFCLQKPSESSKTERKGDADIFLDQLTFNVRNISCCNKP